LLSVVPLARDAGQRCAVQEQDREITLALGLINQLGGRVRPLNVQDRHAPEMTSASGGNGVQQALQLTQLARTLLIPRV